jgi:hypothetical protein
MKLYAIAVISHRSAHEVPMLMQDGFYVLPLAGEFALVVRVCEDSAIREDDVFANFGDLRIDLDLLSDFDDVQELCGEGDGDRTHVGHPQHADCCDYVNHGGQCPAVDGLLDVFLVRLECVHEGCQLWVVLVSVEGG